MLNRLGGGGMGEVFEVEHVPLRKVLVAKVLRAELTREPGLVDRMRVEAQALAALSHPNLVAVTDFGQTDDGRPFFVMERLRGGTLSDEIRARGALPVELAIDIARQMLRALSAAHAIGLIHRDIKLDNVFLHQGPDGERIVKVLDFGVAKVLPRATELGLQPPSLATAEGAVVGTPRYVSPEQVLGRPVDERADLYAVGLVLYTMVAGRGPFAELKGIELLKAQATLKPKPPSAYAECRVPPALDALILRALEKQPEHRFASAKDLERELVSFERDTPSTRESHGAEAEQRGRSDGAGNERSDAPPEHPAPKPITSTVSDPLVRFAQTSDSKSLPFAPTVEVRSPSDPAATEILPPSALLRPDLPEPLPTRTNPALRMSPAEAREASAGKKQKLTQAAVAWRYAVIASSAALTAGLGIALVGDSMFGLAATLVSSILVAFVVALAVNRPL
jgi:serine/threonine-protein kinase